MGYKKNKKNKREEECAFILGDLGIIQTFILWFIIFGIGPVGLALSIFLRLNNLASMKLFVLD